MYKSLQGCRAIAAILVVLFHLGLAIADNKYFGQKILLIPFSFGSAGVEFFFVLSGFIIFSAHKNDISKPGKLTNYFLKRVIRIYPTYWIIFTMVFLLAFSSQSLRGALPNDAVTIIKSFFLIPQDKNINGGTGSPVLIVAWTLQYEMLFYLFFGTLILNKWIGIAFMLLFSFFYFNSIQKSPILFPLSFFISEYMFLFLMGMSVSIACNFNKLKINSPKIYIAIGLLMFLILSLDVLMDTNFFIGQRTILFGISSSIIIFGLIKNEQNGNITFKNKLIQHLGDSSFALYLIHYPLISILCKLSILIGLNDLGVVGATIAYIGIFLSCLISSIIFHLWIEKPISIYFRDLRIANS